MHAREVVELAVSVKDTIHVFHHHLQTVVVETVETKVFAVFEEKGIEVAELLDVADTVFHILE